MFSAGQPRIARENEGRHRALLHLNVFVAGAATMALEMCASRLVAPFFGNSQPVWGLLIGMLLGYMAIGYALGGWLADRHPRATLLYQLAALAGLCVGLLPHVTSPILRRSIAGLAEYQSASLVLSLLAFVAVLAMPTVLLGCVFPFATRLSMSDLSRSGMVAGRLYALSTLGSLLGTFLPVFVLIPNLGTRISLLVVAVSVVLAAAAALLAARHRGGWLYLVALALVSVLYLLPQGAIKPVSGLIYEVESADNYIQVLREGETTLLKLNEGEGIQSAYVHDQILTGYVYDYFLLAPYFRCQAREAPPENLCIIGLAGGTMAFQYSSVYGPLSIDGLEIDPEIIRVARTFMGMNLPNLRAMAVDGRRFLATTSQQYDVIIVDAYIPPYIPFQLTTVEFFALAHEHLAEDGVLALNVARTETDYALVDAIAFTLRRVFPSVYLMDTQSNLNTVVAASKQPTRLDTITANLSNLEHPDLRLVVARAAGRIRESTATEGLLLVDDHAPVEQITHTVVARYLWGGARAR